MLPERNLVAIGAVGANLRSFSFGGPVGPVSWNPRLGKPYIERENRL